MRIASGNASIQRDILVEMVLYTHKELALSSLESRGPMLASVVGLALPCDMTCSLLSRDPCSVVALQHANIQSNLK